MSLESAKAFLERMKIDQEFAQKIMVATTTDSRMTLARAEGFNCTLQEVEQATSKLTDDELDQVVGGSQPYLPKNAVFT